MDRKDISENTESILHALMNSLLGMFYVECLSFGRGDGVADLSSDRFKKCFRILNPDLLNEMQKQNIALAFQPLLDRDSRIYSCSRFNISFFLPSLNASTIICLFSTFFK